MAKEKPKPQEASGGKLSLLPICTDLEDPCSMAWTQGLSRMEQRNLALKALSPKDQFELLVALSAGLSHWRCAQLVKCSPRTVTMYVEYCNETMAGGLLAQGVSLQESEAVASACDFFELLVPHIFELGPRSSTSGVSYILAQELHTMAKTPPPRAAETCIAPPSVTTCCDVRQDLSYDSRQDVSGAAPTGALAKTNSVLPQGNDLGERTKLEDQQPLKPTDHRAIMPQLDTVGARCDMIVRASSHDTQPFITNRIQLTYDRQKDTRIQPITAPELADNGACAPTPRANSVPQKVADRPICIQEKAARPHGDAISDPNDAEPQTEFEAINYKLIGAPVGLEGIVHWAVQVTAAAGFDGASCTENPAPARFPCTGSPCLDLHPCTGGPLLAPSPCTCNQAAWVEPCTGNQESERYPCTWNLALSLDPCTDFAAPCLNPCTDFAPPCLNPCTEIAAPRANPCTDFAAAGLSPCTDFAAPRPNPCTERPAISAGACTNLARPQLDSDAIPRPMGLTSSAVKTDLDHVLAKTCIQDPRTEPIAYGLEEADSWDSILVPNCLVIDLLNKQIPQTVSSGAGTEESRLRNLQRLLWDYWLRHHGQIKRYLQQLQEGGVQGLLMVPSNFKRQASLAAYHEHAQRCQAQAELSETLGSTAQAFAHLSPALQQGVVWELLLSQWYEGVVRYLGPSLSLRLDKVRSLRRVRADNMAKLKQALTQRRPTLSLTSEEQDCFEPELKELDHKPSYRGFMAHHQPRPLLDDLRWERPSHKLNSALKQFMRDPSCRRYRAGLNAS